MDALYIGNNMTVSLNELTDVFTGLPASDATVVELTLLDKTGTPVVGQQWPTILDNVASGQFFGTLEPTLELLLNHTYTADLTATDPEGRILHMECDYQATDRCLPC